VATVTVVALAGVGVVGALALSGGEEPERASADVPAATPSGATPSADGEDTDPEGDGTTAPAAPREATGDELVPAPAADPSPLTRTLAMAGSNGGVRVAALSEVDEVGRGAAARSAPEGGRLIAFRLAGWRCDVPPCRDWSDLGLAVAVGKDVRPLPKGRGTYVVAVPERSMPVDLVLRSDGYRQTLSLRDRRPGPDNIAVLARADRTAEVGRTFSMTDTTSQAVEWFKGGPVTTTAPRSATFESAELGFFGYTRRPSSTREAILVANVFYTRPWNDLPTAFRLEEIKFRDSSGTTYKAFDAHPDPAKLRPGFEVPADLERGTLLLGGVPLTITAEGTSWTQTASQREVPVRFR
jgi:hypothetical protein